MCVISTDDIVLQYFVKKQTTNHDSLMQDMLNISEKLEDKEIYSLIDFKFFNDKLISEAIFENLWYYRSCGVIEEHHSVLTYNITSFGNKISNVLLKNFRENYSNAWTIFNEILDDLIE